MRIRSKRQIRKYNDSEKGIEARRRYTNSEKGKKKMKEYSQSKEGKESRKKNYYKNRGKILEDIRWKNLIIQNNWECLTDQQQRELINKKIKELLKK